MEEYLTFLDKIRKKYQKDSLYLKEQFNDKLLISLQKIIDNYYNEIFNENVKIIEKYSNFDMRILGPILASIVSIFEGHEFVYQDVFLTGDKDVNDYYWHTNYLMLVDRNLWQASYLLENITSLTLNNEAFIIKKTSFSSRTKRPSKSTFEYEEKFYDGVNYYVNGEGDVRPLLKNEQFPYLKEFMDIVITYCIKNSIENIKEDELLALRKEFIVSHMEEITKKVDEYDKLKAANIQKQIEDLTEKLDSQYTEEKKNRQLLLKKVLAK